MRKLSDIGKAESQPVSAEVMEVAQDEVARLSAENKRLKATIEAQQRQLRLNVGNGWQPIETAPLGVEILGLVPLGAMLEHDIVTLNQPSVDDGWYSCRQQDGLSLNCAPVYWMPLPETPEAKL